MIPDNLLIKYHKNGKVAQLYEYQTTGPVLQHHGIYVSWCENGPICMVATYVEGKLHGPYIGYHANGNLAEISNYKNGLPHGQHTTWHSIGLKWEECYYVYGQRNGLYVGWRLNQTPAWRLYYRNGRDVTLLVETIVKDIANITPAEHTQLALQLGFD